MASYSGFMVQGPCLLPAEITKSKDRYADMTDIYYSPWEGDIKHSDWDIYRSIEKVLENTIAYCHQCHFYVQGHITL